MTDPEHYALATSGGPAPYGLSEPLEEHRPTVVHTASLPDGDADATAPPSAPHPYETVTLGTAGFEPVTAVRREP
ncbi:hypothetical protein JW613_32810 [Streptomyces smyrnaeus]|uniref:Uncharacterized protein n=1 Tax=Streptomyces smyrnaeus TaxID=1387713 RepID=A0ABS3Y5T3_9ACTN|nr:hypothetical protein [Streptomyces smyrnaeus]MBO8203024.1 hypothetical protein [Streptomyces smyrnaeus]